jgi:hypothetical protein
MQVLYWNAGDVKFWAVGQALALERALTLYASSRGSNGLLPEFYFFDCQTCHRSVASTEGYSIVRATPNPGRPLPLGVPAFNDSSMIMLSAITRVALPDSAVALERSARDFHASLGQSRETTIEAANRLANTARVLADELDAHSFSRGETASILERLVGDFTSVRYTDWSEVEQVYYAICDLESELNAAGYQCASDPEQNARNACLRGRPAKSKRSGRDDTRGRH